MQKPSKAACDNVPGLYHDWHPLSVPHCELCTSIAAPSPATILLLERLADRGDLGILKIEQAKGSINAKALAMST